MGQQETNQPIEYRQPPVLPPKTGRNNCCLVVLVVGIVCGTIMAYYAYKVFVWAGEKIDQVAEVVEIAQSTLKAAVKVMAPKVEKNPAVAQAWLDSAVYMIVPDEYAVKGGISFGFLGEGFKVVVIGPKPDTLDELAHIENNHLQLGTQNDATGFFVIQIQTKEMEKVNRAFKDLHRELSEKENEKHNKKSEEVVVIVGGILTKAVKTHVLRQGKKHITYLVRLDRDAILLAMGPEEGFDQEAFESMLSTVRHDNGLNDGARPDEPVEESSTREESDDQLPNGNSDESDR